MHCISSSLCFWFWSILRETADSLYHKMAEGNSSEKHYYYPHPHYGLHGKVESVAVASIANNNSSRNNASNVHHPHSLPLTGFEAGHIET
jgi:hypothetical protein